MQIVRRPQPGEYREPPSEDFLFLFSDVPAGAAVDEQSIEGKWVVPNPQIPRSFGLMNIVFGVLLLLTALGFGTWYLLTPTLMRQAQTQVKAEQDREKAERETKIAELKTQEAEAKTAEEKNSLAEERKDLETEKKKKVTVPTMDFSSMNPMADKRLAVYYAIEVSAAVILNVLMIVSGAASWP